MDRKGKMKGKFIKIQLNVTEKKKAKMMHEVDKSTYRGRGGG